jgi:filamentous hemagglutinin
MMAAASAAGEAVSRRIGDFANSKFKAARDNGDQVGMDAWKEGGTARAEMQAAGAALVTGLAGGNAIGGAAGAGIASIAGGRLNELSGAIAGSNPTGNADMNMALGNIVANAIATSAGAAVGGDAGAFEGYNTDRFNRQLNVDGKPEKQRDLVSQACPPGAQCSDAVYQAAIQAQMANGDAATGSLQPNYATVSATSLSGTGSVAVNLYDGSTYLSGGVTQSNPSSVSWKPGVAGTVGWVFGVNGAKGTSNYLNGDATQAYISVPTWLGFNANAAITHGYGGATGIELGIGAPGGLSYGVAPWSHATQVSKPIY